MAGESERIAEELDRFVERLMTRISVNCVAELQERTPVDTAWARSNWRPSIGRPVQAPAPKPVDDPSAIVRAAAASAAGMARVVSSYSIERGSIFIANNVPYIVRLNAGSSKKAPANFVQMSIAATVNRLGG